MSTRSRQKSAPARPARGPQLREALVHHATELLEEQGIAGLNLRRLAARIGVTQPALYRHFADKDALLSEIVARGLGELGEMLGRALIEAEDPYEVLRSYGRTYIRYAAARPGWFRLAFSRDHTPQLATLFPSEVDPRIVSARTPPLRALACIVGLDDPAFGPTFRLIWGLAHGLASLVTERVFQLVPDDDARIATADASFDELISSLRARWGPARALHDLPAFTDADLDRALVPGG